MNRVQVITGIAAPLLLAACAGITGHVSAQGMVTGGTVTGGTVTGGMVTGGTVTGRLVIEGGSLGPGGQQPGERPVPGTVEFTAEGHRLDEVPAGNSGTFSVRLPPGTYAVSGRSPRVIEVSGGTRREIPCSQPLRVTVTARDTIKITVTCVVP